MKKHIQNLVTAISFILVPCDFVAASTTTLIDTTGALTKSIPTLPPTPIIAIVTSQDSLSKESNTVTLTSNADHAVISAPGATLETQSAWSRGVGAAVAGSVASSVILSGVTPADVDAGLESTRHGRTLSELFSSVVRVGGGVRQLIVVVQSEETVDEDRIKSDINTIFNSVKDVCLVEEELGRYFEVVVKTVKDKNDIEMIKSQALSSAPKLTHTKPFATLFSNVYNDIISTSSSDPTPVAEAILACNDAYSRASRMSRAKLALWKHRTSRNLLVDKFGVRASNLLKSALDVFDRDTMGAAGLPQVGMKRLEIRELLRDRTEKMIRELYMAQIGILEKTTMKRFNAALKGKDAKSGDFYAAVVRDAMFAFEQSAASLEVASLGLTKAKPVQDMTGMLNNVLLSMNESPSAKIEAMKKVERAASKRKSAEGSIDVALDFVAMFRPDGFGNLQGFTGYQFGSNSITVGVHNDADDPQVISSFGGVRPPFLRVQPKLKLDVEL